MNLLSVDPVNFWRRVAKGAGCWEWQGARRPTGYGVTYIPDGQTTTSAHRVAYVLAGGVIPEGYQVDHLCKNPRCCNPSHLEAVTPRENTLRGDSPSAMNHRRETCREGHPFDRVVSGARICVTCRNDRQRKAREAARAANPPPARGAFQSAKTHCPQGHPYNADNTYVTRDGKRMCRECGRARNRARRKALAQAAPWPAQDALPTEGEQ